MKVYFAIVVLALTAKADAAGVKRPPHMTGDQFITELRGGPNAQRLFGQHYAQGYLAGVVDATQGRLWCGPSGLKPDTADDKILDELAKRAGSMPGIAAAALLGQYTAMFPAKESPCATTPRLTGDEFAVWLVGNRRKSDDEKLNPGPDVIRRERYADGYVGGVVDATQGSEWCAPRRIKPDELDAIGFWALLDRPRGSMPGNAATLLRQQFVAKFPCSPSS